MRSLIYGGLISAVLFCAAICNNDIEKVNAQSFEVTCPAGTTSYQPLQTFDAATGKNRQVWCIDALGNIQQNPATLFPGTIITVNGSNIASIAQALTALPSTTNPSNLLLAGGTIDARTMPPGSSFDLGTFDPGNKTVTLLLGPWNYTFNQIILRSGLHIIGSGSNVTFLLSTNTTVGSPAIVQLSTADTTDILLSDFFVFATGTANQDGIQVAPNGALNKSAGFHTYKRIVLDEFTGIGINLDASLGTNFGEGAIHDILIDTVDVGQFGGSFAFQAKGAVEPSVRITNSEFSETSGSTETAINLISVSATSFPRNILFDNNFISGTFGQIAQINGAQNITFSSNFLGKPGGGGTTNGFNFAVGTGTMHSIGAVLEHNFFHGNMTNLAVTTDASATLSFMNNTILGVPTILSGFTSNAILCGNNGGGLLPSSCVTSYQICGTTTTCAKTQQQSVISITGGPISLIAGTITIISLPYTSATSYVCTADDSTGINGIDVIYNSGSSVTFNGTATDSIRYKCDGN